MNFPSCCALRSAPERMERRVFTLPETSDRRSRKWTDEAKGELGPASPIAEWFCSLCTLVRVCPGPLPHEQ